MSARGIQLGLSATAGRSGSSRTAPRACQACAGCTFFGSNATSGSACSQMPGGKVTVRLWWTELQPIGADLLRDRGRLPCLRAPCPARSLDCGVLLAVHRDRWRASVRVSSGYLGSVANRSVLHPTRLETRTKESNMCASHGVVRNPKAQ